MTHGRQVSSPVRDRAASGVLYLMAAQAFLLGTGYTIHIALGRVLGPDGYGVYGVILALVGVFNLLLSQGIPQAISKHVAARVALAGSIYRRGISLQAALAILIGAFYFLGAQPISTLLRDPSLIPYIQFSALIIPTYALYQGHLGLFNGMGEFKRQGMLIGVYSVIKVVTALSLVLILGVYGALSGFVLGAVAIVIIAVRLAPGPDANEPAFEAGILLRFAAPYALLAAAINLLMSLDLFMVKALLPDDAQAGYYTVATTLARIPYLVMTAVGLVLLPTVSEAAMSDDQARITELVSRSMRFTLILLVPGVLAGIAVSRAAVVVLYSNAYTPAIHPLSVLLIAMGLLSLYFLLANVIAGAGNPSAALAIALVSLGVSLASGLVLIPRLGLLGASLATLLAAGAAAAVSGAYVFLRYRALVKAKTVARIAVAALPLALAVFLNAQPLPILLLGTAALGVAFFGLMVLTQEIGREDWLEIRHLLRPSQ